MDHWTAQYRGWSLEELEREEGVVRGRWSEDGQQLTRMMTKEAALLDRRQTGAGRLAALQQVSRVPATAAATTAAVPSAPTTVAPAPAPELTFAAVRAWSFPETIPHAAHTPPVAEQSEEDDEDEQQSETSRT